MTVNLHRVLPQDTLDIIKVNTGVTFEPGVTVAQVIASAAGIGYGGHYDEMSDEEEAIHAIVAMDDPDRIAEMHDIRMRYANLVRDTADALAWVPVPAEEVVTVHSPAEDYYPPLWSVSGDLRTTDHPDGNHAWCDEIKARYILAVHDEKIPADVKVEFDTEHSCFFAYAETKQVIETIAEIAQDVYRTWTPDNSANRWTAPEHEVGYYPEN
jgi:hypothetical protein